MRQTEYYALNLPEGPDNYDINDYNTNFKIIDEKMKDLAKYMLPFETIDSVNVIGQLPVNLVEHALYLIPILDQFIPAIPSNTGYNHFAICANVANARVSDAFKGATEFYLYCGDHLRTSIVGKDTLAYTNRTDEYTSYPLCYKYTVDGPFAWEYMSVPEDWGRRQPPEHEIENVIYASDTITSFFRDTVKYETYENVVKADGTLIDAPMATEFKTYFVQDGEAKQRGTSSLKYLLDNWFTITKTINITENGTYIPDKIETFGYNQVTVNVE